MALQTLGTHEQGWELEGLKTINKVSGQKQTSVSIHTLVSPTSVPFQKDLFYCSIFRAFVIFLCEMGRETEWNEPKKEAV